MKGAPPKLTRHVDRLWDGDEALPALIESAEAVERVMGQPGWLAVQAVLAQEIATIDRELDEGAPKDGAEYAQAHGRRSALCALDGAAKAIIERADMRREHAERRVNERAAESVQEAA